MCVFWIVWREFLTVCVCAPLCVFVEKGVCVRVHVRVVLKGARIQFDLSFFLMQARWYSPKVFFSLSPKQM